MPSPDINTYQQVPAVISQQTPDVLQAFTQYEGISPETVQKELDLFQRTILHINGIGDVAIATNSISLLNPSLATRIQLTYQHAAEYAKTHPLTNTSFDTQTLQQENVLTPERVAVCRVDKILTYRSGLSLPKDTGIIRFPNGNMVIFSSLALENPVDPNPDHKIGLVAYARPDEYGRNYQIDIIENTFTKDSDMGVFTGTTTNEAVTKAARTLRSKGYPLVVPLFWQRQTTPLPYPDYLFDFSETVVEDSGIDPVFGNPESLLQLGAYDAQHASFKMRYVAVARRTNGEGAQAKVYFQNIVN